MANGYIEVTKHSPCPICGVGDWCCHIPAEDGYGDVTICKRYTDPRVNAAGAGGDVLGHDGRMYVFLAESKDGYGIYRDEDDVVMAESNGCHVWRKGGYDENAIRGEGSRKKELIPVNIVEEADDTKKDLAYRMLMSLYPLKSSHRDWLVSEGWSQQMFDNMLCSFPVDDWTKYYQKKNSADVMEIDNLPSKTSVCSQIIRELGEDALLGVPGFYLRTDKRTGQKYWYFESRSGIGFPLFNERGQIVRIRVRMDFMDTNGSYLRDDKGLYFVPDDDGIKRYVFTWKGVYRVNEDGALEQEKDKKYRCTGKYRGMSSFLQVDNLEEGTYTNKYECGTEGSNIVGLIEPKSGCNPVMAILTEGEKKAIVGSTLLKAPFCIVPGVSSFNKLFETRIGKNILEHLVNAGTQYFAIAFDADRISNVNVLKAEKGLAMRLLREGLKPLILTWDGNLGKGLDDALLKNAQLQATELNVDNIEEYYSKLGL